MRKEPEEVRFWRMVQKTDGCWLWMGAKFRRGYGQFRGYKGKSWKAHRFAFKLNGGELVPGEYICHRCDNPSCVRPDHLFAGTPTDNVQDCIRKGRLTRKRLTHCKRGHEFTPENTITRPKGKACRTCQLTSRRAMYHRRKAVAA
jgi:hypothetical protein